MSSNFTSIKPHLIDSRGRVLTIPKPAKIKVQKLSKSAVMPKKAHETDAAFDLVAISRIYNIEKQYYEYGTGLAIELEPGYAGLLLCRSSISEKTLTQTNAIGLLDENYRGEIKFRFKVNTDFVPEIYNIGDRIGQILIIPYPQIELEEVLTLSDSERGTEGFGSSGK